MYADTRPLEQDILLAFACGHIVHLTCLLQPNSNSETSESKDLSSLRAQLGLSNGDQDRQDYRSRRDAYSGRSVGAKVAHAQVIKNLIKGGCRVCSEAGSS